MKNLCYIFLAVLLLGGCQKGQLEQTPVSDNDQLMINPSFEGMQIEHSRAAGADVDLSILQTYGFYLAGYHTTGKVADAASDDLSPNVFAKEASDLQDPVPLVSYTDNKFTLKTIKWQLDDLTYLGFFGWSQNKTIPTTGITATTTGIIGQTKNVDDKGFPWIEIRNADAPTDQTDVVGTRSIDHCNDAVISAVDLDFSHLLSKISFSAQSSSGAKVVISSAKIKYAADKVYKKARYTFGGSVDLIGAYGAYAEYHTGSVALNSASVTVNGATPITLGSALLIPQALAAGDVSLELTYAISPNGTLVGTTQTRTLPLSAIALAQGNHYLYTIDLQATEIMLSITPTIEPWNYLNTSLPLIAGPKGATQLLLDGYEKPYQHTDGKWYWLDRSGYNRHVELGAGYVSYNVDKRGYLFKNGTQGGTIPHIGSWSSITVDMVAEGTGTVANQQPFMFGSAILQLPISGSNIDWNYPGGYIRWAASSREVINRLTFWSATYTTSRARLYQNAILRAEKATGSANPSGSNYLAPTYDGIISYLKVSNEERATVDIVADYKENQKRFNIVEPVNPYMPPVTDGLVFCFDGRSGVETINGVRYWRDQVGRNDAKITGNVTYASNGFSVTNTDYMSMIYNVAMSNNYTIEIVLKPKGKSGGQPIFWGTSTTVGTAGRIIALHFPYADTPGSIFVDAPGGDRYKSAWPSGFGGHTDLRQIAIRRNYSASKSEFFMYNRVALSSTKTTIDISTKVCPIMDFGGHGWDGNFYAVRFYNRVLTDDEMKLNYQFDKTNYGFSD